MSIKYLSSSGLTEVWSNIKTYIASKIPSKIITGLSIKGRTITYTNSDGTTGTLTTQDTNTTYASMSDAEATTGTATDARSISAKVLHDKITSITNTKAKDADVVHKSGTETITGTKIFSNVTYLNKEISYKDTKYDWTDTSLDTWCDAGHVFWSDKTGNRRMHELVGTKGGVWRKSCYINEKQYFNVDSNRNITYWGTTIFNGTTGFTSNVICNGTSYLKMTNLESNTTTPTSAQYSNIRVVANDGSQVGNIQFCKRADGSFDTTIYSNIGGSNDGTLRIASNNEVYPLNNKTKLGNSTAKWSEVYANTFNGNLVGNANTATKATQDASGNVITNTYATKTELNTKANDSSVVHRSGNETIAGLKTFSYWQIINMGLNVKWITGHKEQKALILYGSMNDNYQGIGSVLELHGDDANYGMFSLIAKDKTNTNVKRFDGLPDGTLTWGGKKVLTEGNGVTVDTDQTITGEKTFSNLIQARNRLSVFDGTNPHSFVNISRGWIEMSEPANCYIDFKREGSQDFLGRIGLGLDPDNIFYLETMNGAPIKANGKNIVRSVNGVNANQAGNVNLTNILGFTPVQQGGGIGQSNNKIYIGWTGYQLKCTVDKTDLGAFVFEGRAQVGTTITAYWGSSSNTVKWATAGGINGTKRVSSTTNTFTPVVGQIYSGNQLYSTAGLNGGIGDTGVQGPAPQVVYARLDLSGAFSSSYKYLCTTAVGVNATASVDVTGHTQSSSSGPYTTITGYSGFTQTLQGGKSTFLRVQ